MDRVLDVLLGETSGMDRVLDVRPGETPGMDRGLGVEGRSYCAHPGSKGGSLLIAE